MELKTRTVAARAAAATLCAALASALVAANPSNPSNDPSSTTINKSDAAQESPSEARTAQDIDQRLKADPHHFFRHVNVTVHNGVARLGGFVDSEDALAKAKEIAGTTPGISRVDNEMKVQRNGNNANQPD